MTRREAQAEAVKRWGPSASVTGPGEMGFSGYRVWDGYGQAIGNTSHNQRGSGDSWEAAFVDADARSRR